MHQYSIRMQCTIHSINFLPTITCTSRYIQCWCVGTLSHYLQTYILISKRSIKSSHYATKCYISKAKFTAVTIYNTIDSILHRFYSASAYEIHFLANINDTKVTKISAKIKIQYLADTIPQVLGYLYMAVQFQVTKWLSAWMKLDEMSYGSKTEHILPCKESFRRINLLFPQVGISGTAVLEPFLYDNPLNTSQKKNNILKINNNKYK